MDFAERLDKSINRVLVEDRPCPDCGQPAYHGFTDIECPTMGCPRYSEKQANSVGVKYLFSDDPNVRKEQVIAKFRELLKSGRHATINDIKHLLSPWDILQDTGKNYSIVARDARDNFHPEDIEYNIIDLYVVDGDLVIDVDYQGPDITGENW